MKWLALVVLVACSSEPEVRISFSGPGRGFVQNNATDEVCEGPCVIVPDQAVPAGASAPLPLRLTAFAMSRFGGWTGCDEVTGDTCVVSATRSHEVEVAFDVDEHEVTTLIPPFAITTGAFAADGYVLAGPLQLAKVDAAGQLLWKVHPGALAVRVAPSGDVFARRDTAVARLDATGATVWQSGIAAQGMELLPGGAVALATADAVTVLAAADGSVVWTKSVPLAQSIAVSSQGVIAVGTGGASVKRFDATGAALADWTLPRTGLTQLAFDAGDRLHAQVVAPSATPPPPLPGSVEPRVLVRYDAAGTIADTRTYNAPQAGSGFAVGAGRLAWSRGYQYFHTSPVEVGSAFEASDASGATAWMLSKITRGSIGSGSSVLGQWVSVTDAACDGASTCAVFGSYVYNSGRSRRPWMEVVTVP